MKAGKLSVDQLERLVFRNIRIKNKEVIQGAAIGKDCAAVNLGEKVLVVTSDPITAAGKGAGKLAIHVNCNDLATSGAKPLALMITVLAPVGTTEDEIEALSSEMSEEADKLGVDIIGGHTEVTSAVNKIVISITALGTTETEAILNKKKLSVGDKIIMTKTAGLEGTAILAADKETELLSVLSKNEIDEAKKYSESLSVIKEGEIGKYNGALEMHDVTEGGVLGAVWEVAYGAGFGVDVNVDEIFVSEITKKICDFFSINPMRLISSGTMLIVTQDPDKLLKDLHKEGIQANVIGIIKEEGYRIINRLGEVSELTPPDADELFKVIQ